MMEYAFNPNTWKIETEKTGVQGYGNVKASQEFPCKKIIIILEIQTSSTKKYVDLNLMPYKNKIK